MRHCLVVMLLLEAMASSVEAADIGAPPPVPASSDWIITVGADARAVPLYMGSGKWSPLGLPSLGWRRAGSPEPFSSARDGIGMALFDNGVIAVGPVGSLMFPRQQSYSSALNGLGNVGITYEIGGFVDYWALPWLRTRVEVMQGFGAADGIVANFAADAVIPISESVTLSGGPRARAVSAGIESPYFGISQAQSVASGLPAYNAGGGWQAVGAGAQLKYRFNPTWATYGFVEYDKLIGPTASSPIVTEPGGSPNQWKLGLGLSYSFLMHGWSGDTYGQGTAAGAAKSRSFDWLCRGLPQDRIWGPPPTSSPAEAKKCAGSFYVGIENETSQAKMFGLNRFVPPYDYKFGDSYFISGSFSRTFAEIGPYISYELETGAGQRFGSLHEEEIWLALYGRWRYFPWNDYLRTTVAFSTGLNYASAVPQYEDIHSGRNQGQRLLHYLSPELTFGLPSMPDTDLVIRSHHRSGGGQFFGNNVPLYGSLFHGIEGGVQYVEVGIRQHF